jgi:DNA-binding phage protein
MLTDEDARRMARAQDLANARIRIGNAIDQLEDALQAKGEPQLDLIHRVITSLKYTLDFLIPKGD